MDNRERALSNKDESAAKNQKVIMLKVKFEWNVNGIIGEIVTVES